MSTLVTQVQVHGPGGPLGNHGKNPKIYVKISVSDFVRDSITKASCKLNYATLVSLGSRYYFGYYIELGARVCSSSDSDDESLIQSLFYKPNSPNTWNTGVIGKGTYEGTVLKTYNSSGVAVNNPGVTDLSCTTLSSSNNTVELRLYLKSNCSCQSEAVGPNGWVKVTATSITDYFKLTKPTLAIKQNGSNISQISAQEIVNLVTTTSGETPSGYVYEYAYKNLSTDNLSAYKVLSGSSSTINFTHNAQRESSDFGTTYPINLYFRVKTTKSGYTDSDYSNVVSLKTLYNPTSLQSYSISYYDQNGSLVNNYSQSSGYYISLGGKFRLNAVAKSLSSHLGNCSAYDVKLCNQSGSVLANVLTDQQMPASNFDISMSSINSAYSGNMQPGTIYKLKISFHYKDTSVSSSSSYYGKYPNTSNDHPLEYFTNEFKLGLAPEIPELIYPSPDYIKHSFNDSPKIIFRVYNPSGMNLQYPEITNVVVTYSDGYQDSCTISESTVGSPEITNSGNNLGRFVAIRKGKTSVKGYTIVYQVRPFSGKWFIQNEGFKLMNTIKIKCTNFMGTASGDLEVTEYMREELLNRVTSGTLITSFSAYNLGNCCKIILSSYSKLINDYTDESSSVNRIYNQGSSNTYNEALFRNHLIFRDNVGEGSEPTPVISLWLNWLALPKSSAIGGKYGIFDKLASYGGITETRDFNYNQALVKSDTGNLINAKTWSSSNYYNGNIYNVIVDLLLKYI